MTKYNHNKRIKCDKCKEYYSSRNVIFFKGIYQCHKCRRALPNVKMNLILPFPKDINECLNKTYEIKPVSRNTNIGGMCYFNKLLIGKKFKIQLIEDDV